MDPSPHRPKFAVRPSWRDLKRRSVWNMLHGPRRMELPDGFEREVYLMMPTPQRSEALGEEPSSRIGLGRGILLWVLFFLICFGLGYATLNRYDPRATNGISDTIAYYEIVARGPTADLEFKQFRVLVPFLARPFYRLAEGRVGTWDPVFFGLLMANSLLVATTAFLLVRVGDQQVGELPVALLGATIYLLNFDVPNLRLAGLIDAGEGCFLMVLIWALFTGRWWLLPFCGVCGASTKESFVPLSTVLVCTWWLVSSRQHVSKVSRAVWAAVMVLAEVATFIFLHASLTGHIVWPWQFAATLSGGPNYVRRFVGAFADRQSWYSFMWLLPLGVWRVNRLARPWGVACLTTTLMALLLNAYHVAGPGAWGREVFSIAGPFLSLCVALLLSRPVRFVVDKRQVYR